MFIKKNRTAQQFFFISYKGEEALAKARELQIQNENRRMYQELKAKNKNKNDKVDKILQFLTQQASKSTNADCGQDEDEQIDNTLRKFAENENESDLEHVNKNNKPNDGEQESKEETLANENSLPSENSNNSLPSDNSNNALPPSMSSFFAKGSEEVNHHSTVPIYHTQKLHVFIDNLTSNRAVDDEAKEEITLAFYDNQLKQHVVPYFDSLCLTNKSFTDIANSLIWFIRCLKNKNVHQR